MSQCRGVSCSQCRGQVYKGLTEQEELMVKIIELPSHPSSPETLTFGSLLAQRTLSTMSSAMTSSAPMHMASHSAAIRYHTTAIVNNNSPFYSNFRYCATQFLATSAHLCNITYINRSTHRLGTITRIAPTSEFAGIPLHISISIIIHIDDTLLLYSVATSPGSSPLVITFAFHPSSTSRLRIFVHENNRIHYLSEPAIVNTEPVEAMLLISLAPKNNYRYQVAFVRQDHL